ncbi:alpha/beta fold hydrolase [Dactylosporangium sp. CA-233914]|uniref:alpha/beta fold hydrolase n=1 Tax=Dactylosporangium sp. CA-233914 TaxID=3239934 RepID=UPI003D9046F6
MRSVLVLALLLATVLAAPAPARAGDDCPVEVPPGTVCGRLDRGHGVGVRYAVHRSDSPGRRPDPIVFTSGGPGSPSLGLLWYLTSAPFGKDRDVVVVEQRGSRYSEPRLSCPELDRALLDRLAGAGEATLVAAGRACRDRLARAGIDPGEFNTRAIAGDVVALRHALGYASWNLFGVSYSTRSMLAAAAADPGGTRAVVLDSFLPASTAQYDVGTLDLRAALERVRPGLSGELARAADRLERRPARVAVTDPLTGRPLVLRLTGQDVAGLVAEGMQDADFVTALPPLLRALAAGHDELLPGLAQVAAGSLVSHDTGVYYAVNCQDEVPFNTFAADAGPRSFFAAVDPAVCRGLGLPAGDDTGAATAAPALVLGGAFDPATPVGRARAAAARDLPGATVVEFAGLSHAVFLGSACARATIAAFLDAPGGFAWPCDPAASPYRTLGPGSVAVTSRAYDLAADPWRQALPAAALALAALVTLGAGALRRRAWAAGAGAPRPGCWPRRGCSSTVRRRPTRRACSSACRGPSQGARSPPG